MNNVVDPKVLELVPQQRQAQGAVYDQLVALHVIANRFGLYDAADLVRDLIEAKPFRNDFRSWLLTNKDRLPDDFDPPV